jgi:uncharacterized delta-60 repeat protein
MASAACGPNIPGNLTGDCRVNFDDFAILAADWRIHPNDCPPNFPPGDLNLDCSVNSLDLDQMALHWLQSCMGPIPADLSGDCHVDFNDFTVFAADWLHDGDAQPEIKWMARYNGPDNNTDWAQAVAVDSNDNIYVTGSSFVSYISCDYTTIKYLPDSNEAVWVARYNGPDNYIDRAQAIAVDSNDNIYVTGFSDGSGTGADYTTIKYSPDSNEPVWVGRYNNGSDGAFAIAVDSNDNIYVTGSSDGSGTSSDYATIKYSPDSNQPIWVARYDGPGNNVDQAFAIAVDSNDNIYVTGYSDGSATEGDYATIKYSPDSNQPVWVARYNGPAYWSFAIAVDSNDNIYVTGSSDGSGTGADYTTIKYSPDSNQPVWVARYNGPGNWYDDAYDIAIDSNDNIYVTGQSWGSDTEYDFATIKYSPDSNQPVWVARHNGQGGLESETTISVDSQDNIYVTGYSDASETTHTIKYSPDSNLPVWVAIYNGPSNEQHWAEAIAVDSNDNIYVTGLSFGSVISTGYGTIKYSPDYTCTQQITGDFDLDCDVDIYDLEIFCQSWLECNLDPPQDCWQ